MTAEVKEMLKESGIKTRSKNRVRKGTYQVLRELANKWATIKTKDKNIFLNYFNK